MNQTPNLIMNNPFLKPKNKFMRNLKDTITTIAGIMIAVGGVLLALTQAGITLPAWCNTLGVALPIIGSAIVAYFSGKAPNGATKTPEQIEAQNPIK